MPPLHYIATVNTVMALLRSWSDGDDVSWSDGDGSDGDGLMAAVWRDLRLGLGHEEAPQSTALCLLGPDSCCSC
jgi:hypothetical protein